MNLYPAGTVAAVRGVVLDVDFPRGNWPPIPTPCPSSVTNCHR